MSVDAVPRTVTQSNTRVQAWSPARIYLVVSGVFLVAVSVVGFVVNSTFPIGADEVGTAGSGYTLGVFETNGWHNLAGLVSGIVALGFALKPEWARVGALLKGTLYVIVTTSIAIWGGETFWLASNTADQIVHGTLAVTGLAAGLATPRQAP
jgi:hypothetical protein